MIHCIEAVTTIRWLVIEWSSGTKPGSVYARPTVASTVILNDSSPFLRDIRQDGQQMVDALLDSWKVNFSHLLQRFIHLDAIGVMVLQMVHAHSSLVCV